jgi:branched-chain amino acid transport system ATP-binding protein
MSPEPILLDASHVSKVFGGVRAVDDVSMQVREGTIHALIGPNGAGKTTFFNAVSGYAMPDSGTVRFRGQDVTRARNWKRVVMGMGRTFQTPSVFPELTVDENVRLGVRAHAGQAFRLRAPRGERRGGGRRARRRAARLRQPRGAARSPGRRARARLAAAVSRSR